MNIEQQRAAFEAGWKVNAIEPEDAEHQAYLASCMEADWKEYQAATALDRQQRGEPVAKRLIGWRSADYLMETSDRKKAENWQANIEVLPIFEGDPHTQIVSPQPAAPVVKESLTVAEPWPADWIAQLNSEYERGLEDAWKDAARYRWLRDQNASLELNTLYVGSHRKGAEPAWIGSDLDAAINAAMQQEDAK